MDEELGRRILSLLRDKHMTQKQLAVRANVTEAAISHYIKGDRMPRSSVLAKLADALGTTPDYLLGGEAQDSKEELLYAKRLIARNVSQMTTAEKREILNILLGDD